MPKTKSSPKKKTTARQPAVKRAAKPPVVQKQKYSEEYAEYLERYELFGAGRPCLSPADFDRLDDELLDLIAQEMEHGLDDEQTIRVRELEFLLLDSEQ